MKVSSHSKSKRHHSEHWQDDDRPEIVKVTQIVQIKHKFV